MKRKLLGTKSLSHLSRDSHMMYMLILLHEIKATTNEIFLDFKT